MPTAFIDLDQNATTRPRDSVIAAVHDTLSAHWHNPSSIHRPGQDARRIVELARTDLAELIGARTRDLILTSGGTEALDLAIRGVLEARSASAAPTARDTAPVVVSARTEHAAVRDLLEELEKQGRARARWVEVDRAGVIRLAALEEALDEGTPVLAVFQWANNETGVVQPIEEIGVRCRGRGVRLVCDGTQWVGKNPASVRADAWPMGQCPFDVLTFSPHKFHGPKGVGVLWSGGTRLRPQLLGAQELGRRGGTENVPGIAGAGAAAKDAMEWLADPAHLNAGRAMRDHFEALVCAACPGAVVNGAGAARLWNTTNIAFPRLEAEALLLALSERGVAASAGAACSSGSLDPSPVLLAMGIPEVLAHGSLRFSLGRDTTRAEIEQAAVIIGACVRGMSV